MAIVSVRIPQIGEGLQEARLVSVLKQPGDRVERDEPIYQMETDKAVMDVESPYEGILTKWLAEPDSVLAIGAEVALMEIDGPPEPAVSEAIPAAATAARNVEIPPRTRAHALASGISDADLLAVPRVGSKLMPEDIDRFLASRGSPPLLTGPTNKAPEFKSNIAYDQQPFSASQKKLSSRLIRGTQSVVQGTISVAINWEPIESERARIQASGDPFRPSVFTMFAFAVTQALKRHPIFRSSVAGEDAIRTYHHVSLGIAVSLPGDELVVAVVEDADSLTWREFADAARAKIELARTGQDQVTEAVTLSLTNMQSFGLRDAVPVVVAPSVATLFLGEVYNGLAQDTDELKLQRTVNLALGFDHRLINGVGASEFLRSVKQNVETISSILV